MVAHTACLQVRERGVYPSPAGRRLCVRVASIDPPQEFTEHEGTDLKVAKGIELQGAGERAKSYVVNAG